MLEVLAAVGAVTGLAVAAWPRSGARAVPAALGASGVSLTVSGIGLVDGGRTSGWLSLFESFALLAIVFFALRRAPGRAGAVTAALAAAAAMLIIPAHDTASDSLVANAAGMAVWGFGALAAAGAARYLDALDVRRARSVAEARREQRLSLARDLHDFVAHDVSAIVVQAQAAQLVAGREPAEAVAALERIEEAGLHALSAMDRAVEALRDAASAVDGEPLHGERVPDERAHGLVDLQALAARFAATAAVHVELDVDEHDADAVPPEVAGTAYRLVTEALTNVRRHAPGATRVEVRVARTRSRNAPALTVSVINDGVDREPPATSERPDRAGGGFGLAGLREHVEALGGTLQAGSDEHGRWHLEAWLPQRSPALIRT
jgi:signal transduction histidine kinase